MSSVFPGIDPYLEGQEWEDFHADFIATLRAMLSPHLMPKYLARVERRVYVEHTLDASLQLIRPDLAVTRKVGISPRRGSGGTALLPELVSAPVPIRIRMPEEMKETYLEIRLRENRELISVIEVLSPTNKRPYSDGRREYMAKREAVLQTRVHLVELDLLRGGERMPSDDPLPPGDYFALVSRASSRPVAEVWPWTVREPLPVVPIPLSNSDPDVTVDLQKAFETVYENAGYNYSLDYTQGTTPPLPVEDTAWAQTLLSGLENGSQP